MTVRAAPLFCAAALAALSVTAAQPELTELERAGRAIYEEGRSRHGDAFGGRIGMGDQRVPGEAVRCANCHGRDGQGRPEGGVRPANITWSELTKSYGHTHDNGRRHPRFDEQALKRAITTGHDPAGNALDGAMPRFDISARDLDGLVAYLKTLETRHDPGVAADTLRLGTLVPAGGAIGDAGRAVQGILRAYLARINEGGGIYGRRLELVVAEYDDPADARRKLRELAKDRDVFALVSPFAAGIEKDLAAIAGEARIPVIGPLALFADDAGGAEPLVFHLLSGVRELAELLAMHAAADPKVPTQPAVLLHADDERGTAVASALEEQLASQGWTHVSRIAYRAGRFDAPGVAKTLDARAAQTVFVLGPGADVRALATSIVASGRTPLLLVPGPLAPPAVLDLPKALDKRVVLAYPTIPPDQKPDALREYAALFRSGSLARGHQTLQVPAYSSVVLLVETLRRIGREPSRAKLVAALESLQGFEPGLVPALSFNSRRRIGALGGYVVVPDLKTHDFRAVGGFVPLQ